MRTWLIVAIAGLLAAGTGFATADEETPAPDVPPTSVVPRGVERGMQELNASGEVGTVTLIDQGGQTRVVIRLHGQPGVSVQPAHIHRGQSCDQIDPKPAYALQPVVASRSSTILNAPMAKLLSGNYSVNVHASASSLQHYVSCGHLYR